MTTLDMSKPSTLPELSYHYGDLEPFISAQIMELHHRKHHQAYIDNFNAARMNYLQAEEEGNIEGMLALQKALTFNGGGHINHALFWQMLAPAAQGGGEEPTGPLMEAIQKQFGSFQTMQSLMIQEGKALQGSGWVWLAFDPKNASLNVVAMPNQNPLAELGLKPIFGIDVWEHAYYLQYLNARPKYLEQIWHVVNWKFCAQLFVAASS